MPTDNESFVSRWSRRKQAVTNEQVQTEALQEHEAVELPIADTTDVIDEVALAEAREAQRNALTDEDMPDIETLNEGSDFSGFMSTNVSEALRKMALRKLFQGESYNIRDGLDEYDGDYTTFEKLDPSVITADMKHMIEVESERLLAKEKEAVLKAEMLAANESNVESLDDEEIEDIDDGIDDEVDIVEGTADTDIDSDDKPDHEHVDSKHADNKQTDNQGQA